MAGPAADRVPAIDVSRCESDAGRLPASSPGPWRLTKMLQMSQTCDHSVYIRRTAAGGGSGMRTAPVCSR
jgi:hypothetical protein